MARVGRKQRKQARLRRAVLVPACVNFDLEYDEEVARPGTTPPQRAFQLASAGYDMMIATVASSRAFPAPRATTRWRGARAARAKFLWTGLQSSIFLGHAIPVLTGRMEGKVEDGDGSGLLPADPEYHFGLRQRIQDFYPLPSEHKLFLHGALAEFRVMGNHEPRAEVLEGKHPAMPYSQALMRGENPDDDPALLAEQKRYARDFFINQALVAATKIVLEHESERRGAWKFFRDAIVDLAPRADDSRARALRVRSLRAWLAGSSSYRDYALMYHASLVDEMGTVA